MDLPSKSDPIWEKVLSGEKQVEFSYLGIKISLGRLMRSKDDMAKRVDELYALFEQNISSPKVQDDIKLLKS